MVTRDDLQNFKNQYWNIYYIDIEGYEFLFRELSRREYKQALRNYEDVQEQEDYICRLCILEPLDFDYDECPAGIPESLAGFILKESGFGEDTGKIKTYMEHYKAEMTTFDNQISCIVHEAFPMFTLEEIEEWPMEKVIWYYSRAEYILESLRGLELQFVAPGEATQPKQEEHKQEIVKPTTEIAKPSVTKVDNQLVGEHSEVADFPELGEIKRFMSGKLFEE